MTSIPGSPAAPAGPNGSETAYALELIEQLRAEIRDIGAKTLAEQRATREHVQEQLKAYGEQAALISGAVAELAKDIRERLPAPRRRKGA